MKRYVKRVLTVLLFASLGTGGWAVISSGQIASVLGFTSHPAFPVIGPGADLTAGTLPLVRMAGQDPAERATIYEVWVKNMTVGPVPTKSLVLIVDHVTDNRTGEEVGHHIDVLNADGYTREGNAYYRVEAKHGAWIAPAEAAKPIRVKFRERGKIPFFTPSFRVREVPAQG